MEEVKGLIGERSGRLEKVESNGRLEKAGRSGRVERAGGVEG